MARSNEQSRERRGMLAETQGYGDGKRCEQMRALDLAIDEPVADRRPRDVAHQFKRDAVFHGEAALLRGGKDRAIGQRQESDPDRRHLGLSSFCFPSRSSAAVSKAWAISEMRLLCRMAVPRSSA